MMTFLLYQQGCHVKLIGSNVRQVFGSDYIFNLYMQASLNSKVLLVLPANWYFAL